MIATEEEIDEEVETGVRTQDKELSGVDKVDVGIDQLVSDGVFDAAFPLHEVGSFVEYSIKCIKE